MRDKLLMRIELWRNSLGRWMDNNATWGDPEPLQVIVDQMTQTLREANNATPRYRREARKHLSELDLPPDIGGTRNHE